MKSIRHLGRVLVVASLLGLPAFASAEQAPSELCGGEKAEDKQPSDAKAEARKPPQKSEDPSKDATDAPAKQGQSEKS